MPLPETLPRSGAQDPPRTRTGVVHLVGAGPGDPDLLTIKAARVLAAADVVVYDYLVNPAVLVHCRPGVRTEFVGKRAGQQHCSQQAINQRLVALARAGETVVRLKGGDPFVFGRGGEEQAVLQAAGIRCEVVPGITAGIAAPAAAGIAVTHREHCSAVTFLTGHARDGGDERHNYAALAKTGGTLVCYMAVGQMARIAASLIAGGKPPTTPVAIIRHGTWAIQETWRCQLDEVGDLIAREGIQPPAIVVIGTVVGAS
jgi:uroporphyrin-III C-methyltransferase